MKTTKNRRKPGKLLQNSPKPCYGTGPARGAYISQQARYSSHRNCYVSPILIYNRARPQSLQYQTGPFLLVRAFVPLRTVAGTFASPVVFFFVQFYMFILWFLFVSSGFLLFPFFSMGFFVFFHRFSPIFSGFIFYSIFLF